MALDRQVELVEDLLVVHQVALGPAAVVLALVDHLAVVLVAEDHLLAVVEDPLVVHQVVLVVALALVPVAVAMVAGAGNCGTPSPSAPR